MAVVEIRKNVGPQGLADVRILKDAVRVHFAEGEVFDLPKEALDKDQPQGRYNVTLNQDKTKIIGLKPVAGQYIAEFYRIGNRTSSGPNDPGIPSSKVSHGGPRQSRDGKKKWFQQDEIVWVVEAQLTDLSINGIYAGLRINTNVPYSFVRPVSGNITTYRDSTRNMQRLETLFRVMTGKTLTDIDIPYSDNPSELLLRYEEFLRENSRPFFVNVGEKGFMELESISPVPVEFLGTPKKVKKAKK